MPVVPWAETDMGALADFRDGKLHKLSVRGFGIRRCTRKVHSCSLSLVTPRIVGLGLNRICHHNVTLLSGPIGLDFFHGGIHLILPLRRWK